MAIVFQEESEFGTLYLHEDALFSNSLYLSLSLDLNHPIIID